MVFDNLLATRCVDPTLNVAPACEHATVQSAPIDLAALSRRCMGNASLVSLLIDEFVSSSGQRIDALAALAAASAGRPMAEAAHSLKGAAAIIGADAVCALAASLENDGMADDVQRAEETVAELKREFARCVAQVSEIRRTS